MGQFQFNTGELNNRRMNWFDNKRKAYQDCSSGQCKVVLSDYTVIADKTDAQTVIAGAGVCAWLNNHDASVHDNLGRLFIAADLPAWDGYIPGVSADGAYAYKVTRNSFGPWRVIEKNGDNWLLTPNDARAIQLLSDRKAIWMEGYVPHSNFGLVFPDVQSYSFRACWVGDHYILLHQRVSDGALVCDHHMIGPGGNYFYYDIQFMSNKVRINWAVDPGDINLVYREYTLDQIHDLPHASTFK